jgi:dTDP-4-dehydrorhamnose reductase
MKVLVLGGAGQVARAVVAHAPKGLDLRSIDRRALDITDEAALGAVIEADRPDWIVNGAAYTAVDRAESEPDLAVAINDAAVGSMARSASRSGARLLHLSTDFVFDGAANRAYRPDDPTHPQSVYASSKLGGERQALESGGAIVLRTAWVYASSGRNFALTMLRLMREKPEIRVVADQIGTPTWATSIAQAIWALIEGSARPGIYHWTDLGVASWYDFAVAIQEEAMVRGLLTRAIPIVPITTAEYPTPARRPAFSVLDTAATRALVHFPVHHWRHQLRAMLDELKGEAS